LGIALPRRPDHQTAWYLSDDITLTKTILRDYINATVGFNGLAEATHIPPKSLMRMFTPAGNPRADNLFEIVNFLQHHEGVLFHIRQTPSQFKAQHGDPPQIASARLKFLGVGEQPASANMREKRKHAVL
jgi:hypothetical protein